MSTPNVPMQRDTIFRNRIDDEAGDCRRGDDPGRRGQAGAWPTRSRSGCPELLDMRVLDTPGGPLDKTHPARRPITVDDYLMTHRSGLAYFFLCDRAVGAKAYSRISGAARIRTAGWQRGRRRLPLQHQPGERLT